MSPRAALPPALPRVLGAYCGAVRSRVELDEAIAAAPDQPDVQGYVFDLEYAAMPDCWPLHPATREPDSVLVDARFQRNEMAFINDARGAVSGHNPLAPGASAEMPAVDAARVSVRFVDVAVGGLPYVIAFQVAPVAPGHELLCDYGVTYWVAMRRACQTGNAVRALLARAPSMQPAAMMAPAGVVEAAADMAAEGEDAPEEPTPSLLDAPLPARLSALAAVVSAGSAGVSPRAPAAGRLRSRRSAAAPELLDLPLSAGGAKLDDLRMTLLQVDGAMPPIESALVLPFGVSFDKFFERDIRKWRRDVLEAADGAQLKKLALKLASWIAPIVLPTDWNVALLHDASAEEVVAALQAGVVQAALDALWKEADEDATKKGQALYAQDEDATWHSVLSTQVARTRTATASACGLSLLKLQNGEDWRDAVLGALAIQGAGAPPPRIARLLMRAARRRKAGGGLLDLSNAKASRDEVERILALHLTAGPAGVDDAPQGASQLCSWEDQLGEAPSVSQEPPRSDGAAGGAGGSMDPPAPSQELGWAASAAGLPSQPSQQWQPSADPGGGSTDPPRSDRKRMREESPAYATAGEALPSLLPSQPQHTMLLSQLQHAAVGTASVLAPSQQAAVGGASMEQPALAAGPARPLPPPPPPQQHEPARASQPIVWGEQIDLTKDSD